MKKIFLMLLSAAFMFLSNAEAQTTYSIMEEIKTTNLFDSDILTKLSELSGYLNSPVKSRANAAGHSSEETQFTERVRIPDLSDDNKSKLYRLRHVGTGEFLCYDKNDKKFKTTENAYGTESQFYFRNNSYENGAYSVAFFNVRAGVNKLKGLGNDTFLYFNVAENNSGFYITEDNDIQGDSCWRYNPESKEIVIDGEYERAVWECIALPSIPQLSTAAVDTLWYVVKNVANDRYLHYNGADQPMNTVIAPDSCSLFYALPTDNGIELYNYSAGELVCEDVDRWGSTGTSFSIQASEDGSLQYFISQSGDRAAEDIWYVDENGILQSGAYGEESSLWEFENITNFKEIFGLSSNGTVDTNEYLSLVLKVFNDLGYTESISTYKYALVLYSLFNVLVYYRPYLGTFDAVKNYKTMYNRLFRLFSHMNLYSLNEELIISNIGYVDSETGDVIKNTLATNSTLLEVNNAANAHTNVWQVTILKVGDDFSKVVWYNKAIGKYLGKPVDEDGDGNATVEFVSNVRNAGNWSVTLTTEEILLTLMGMDDIVDDFKMETMVVNNENGVPYYLLLPNKDLQEVKCRKIQDKAELSATQGLLWLFEFGTANISEKFHRHADDAARLYPQLLQSLYGLVKEGDTYYSSNCEESTMGISSLSNLVDYDAATGFGTEMACEHEKHYLQAELSKSVRGFYFYMKPYTQMVYGVPMSVKVEGSTDGESYEYIGTVNTSTMYENMYYFSGLVNGGGTAYRYLRFTIDETNTPGGYPAFALTEFYIFPDNDVVAGASQLINEFYSKNYMGEEILEPALQLVKLKAQYYLEQNVDNHSEIPVEGKYSTEKYNALKVAYDNVKSNDADSVDALLVALDEFLNSLYVGEKFSIYIMESAWEDGYSAGWAVGVDPKKNDNEFFTLKVKVKDANIWDMRQWIAVKNSGNGGSNYYDVYFPALKNNDDAIEYGSVYIDEIPGWKNLYRSRKPAYNISMGNENEVVYFGFSKERNFTAFTEPVTVANRKEYCEESSAYYGAGAWYLTNAGYMTNEDYNIIVRLFGTSNNEFVNNDLFESFADFGRSCSLADMYRTGEKKGKYVYEENDGLTLEKFEELYALLKPHYSLGPVEVCKKVVRGEYSNAVLMDILAVVQELKQHFPNFKDNSSTDAIYYRIKGATSGNYVISDMDNGTLKMAEYSPEIEISSVFYSTLTQNEDFVKDVVSYNNGRYIKAVNGKVKYDVIPKMEENYTMQGCAIEYNENGYVMMLDGEHYLIDGGTGMTSQYAVDLDAGSIAENRYWTLEIVDKLPVKITSAGVASFYAPVELVIPDGVVAYVLYDEAVTTSDNSHMDITTGKLYNANTNIFNLKSLRGGKIPAGMPVLLKGNEGVHYFGINYERTLLTEADIKETYCYDEEITNLLEGAVPTTYVPVRDGYIHYILSKKNDVVGMYKVTTYNKLTSSDGVVTTFEAGKESFQNNGHRAWLPMPAAKSKGAASYQFAVGYSNDDTTGIVEVLDGNALDGTIFDLQGRRLEEITGRGIYIVDGKRVLVK